jgi:deoxyribose-phosphate aldolase
MSVEPEVPAEVVRDLVRRIDHTLLDAGATTADVERLCAEALTHGFASVCVNPIWVPRCSMRLEGSTTLVCSVIGFPLGAHLTEVKALEARRAVEQGARELDMVGLIGALREGDLSAFELDVAAVVAAAGGASVKVILEVSRLEREQKIAGARAAIGAGASFVKTSTGASGGATVDDVRLLRETVGPTAGVKASGGVRSYAQARALLDAGANRLGTSSGVVIAGEAAAS